MSNSKLSVSTSATACEWTPALIGVKQMYSRHFSEAQRSCVFTISGLQKRAKRRAVAPIRQLWGGSISLWKERYGRSKQLCQPHSSKMWLSFSSCSLRTCCANCVCKLQVDDCLGLQDVLHVPKFLILLSSSTIRDDHEGIYSKQLGCSSWNSFGNENGRCWSRLFLDLHPADFV